MRGDKSWLWCFYSKFFHLQGDNAAAIDTERLLQEVDLQRLKGIVYRDMVGYHFLSNSLLLFFGSFLQMLLPEMAPFLLVLPCAVWANFYCFCERIIFDLDDNKTANFPSLCD